MEDNLQNELEKEEEEQYNDGLDEEDDELIKEEENNKNIHDHDKNSKNEEDKNIRKPGEKQKRRSKNECYGRDYKCGCGKEYLSYPALYTHIKTKHDGKTPEGTNANQIQNGKGRGRPRKNFLTNEDAIIRRKRENNRRYNENQSNELKDFLNHSNCSSEYFNQGESKFIMIYHFFDLLKKKGEEKYKNINSNNNNENNNENKNKNENNIISNDINDSEEKYNIKDLFNEEMINNSNGYKDLYNCCLNLMKINLTDIDKIEKKETITCDQSFILYLFYISKFVKKEFCKINLMVLKHFRDLINILGWNLLSEYKSLDDEETYKDFCSIKEPLKIPLIAGDFCNTYMKEVMRDFDVYFGVVIISHFNFWLYANDLTFIKLNLPNIINEKEIKMKEKVEVKNNNNEIAGKENEAKNKNEAGNNIEINL